MFNSQVKWVEQQRILERSKRDVIQGEDELVQRSVATLRQDTAFTIRDPFFKDQWYLVSSQLTMGQLLLRYFQTTLTLDRKCPFPS